MVSRCPNCKSEYIYVKSTQDTAEKRTETYVCRNCKHVFVDEQLKKPAKGTEIMTLFGSFVEPEPFAKKSDEHSAKIWLEADGQFAYELSSVEYGYNGYRSCGHWTTRARAYISVYGNEYNLPGQSSKISFECNGTEFDAHKFIMQVKRIEMSDEMTTKALESEIMRINHLEGNTFRIPYNDKEVRGMAAWLTQQLTPRTSSKGCYVATAVYDSYDCPQVWTLRRFRDNILAESWYGRSFIRIYYTISPTMVKWFGNTEWFKKLWKPILDRLVERLKEIGIEDIPYEDREW